MELKEYLQPHEVLIPLPLQGHITPFTHLAMKLASKGFTIIFVNTESTHNDGFPLSFDWSANASQFVEGLIHVFQAHVDDFIENLVLSKPNPPISCIIADSFHVWGSTIAKKYNLVNVSFWTEPATVLTVYYHMDLLKSNGQFVCHGMNQIS
ncbi:hypothetical protein EJD97_002695 [Solanum chilense]|uniref:Uncharacterized protein n=1 Tax=Solanum chilense TaxID=4083 RepID=A0A6N2C0U5_SOLCI|nr:hypothetical protein EJD97_002695 [Solanum chilense]